MDHPFSIFWSYRARNKFAFANSDLLTDMHAYDECIKTPRLRQFCEEVSILSIHNQSSSIYIFSRTSYRIQQSETFLPCARISSLLLLQLDSLNPCVPPQPQSNHLFSSPLSWLDFIRVLLGSPSLPQRSNLTKSEEGPYNEPKMPGSLSCSIWITSTAQAGDPGFSSIPALCYSVRISGGNILYATSGRLSLASRS